MTQSEFGKKVVKAIVTDVIRDGLNSFAVARVSDIPGTVTFSLHPAREVWQEVEYPTPRIVVALSDLRHNHRGWRAYQARFLRPEDEVQ